MSIKIHQESSQTNWLECVLENFDEFLIDHAANERKASSMAMSLVAHYPDREELVREMIDLSLEELNHFRQVVRIMQDRGLIMLPDEKDPYVNQIRKHIRKDTDGYFLDRLLSGAVIEARGEERFRLLASALDDEKLKTFYTAIANSEQGHHELFIRLSNLYFDEETVKTRLNDWIAIEQSVLLELPVRPRLH